MRIIFTISLVVLFASYSVGQKSWFIGAGPTFMLPGKALQSDLEEYFKVAALPPFSTLSMDATGRFGLFAEVGRSWMNRDKKIIQGIELGLHYKSLTGRETITATRISDTTSYFHRITHKTRFVGLDLNLLRDFDWTDRLTWRHMIGINGDYGFISDKIEGESPLYLVDNPDRNILIQLHYRLGLHIKTKGRWSFMPSIETPLLTAYPWANGRSTLEIWNYRYRPLIFCVRIMLEDKRESPMDKGCLEIPEKRERPELWDPEMRKFKKGKSKGGSKGKDKNKNGEEE